MGPEIRPATIHDWSGIARIAGELSGLHARALPDVFREVPDSMPADYLRELIDADDVEILVADRDGAIVGYEVLRVRESPPVPFVVSRRYVLLSDIAVSEAEQGRGIGRLVVEAAIQWARERGMSEIELSVYEFNDAAIAFYEHLGFRATRRMMALRLGED